MNPARADRRTTELTVKAVSADTMQARRIIADSRRAAIPSAAPPSRPVTTLVKTADTTPTTDGAPARNRRKLIGLDAKYARKNCVLEPAPRPTKDFRQPTTTPLSAGPKFTMFVAMTAVSK